MFRNYLKTATRSLLKSKFYSAVNITGMAIGLAVGILILLWVQDELSYDSFHKNTASIYKINSHIGTGADAQVWSGAPAPLAVYCKQSIPDVTNAVRIKTRWEQVTFTYGDKKFIETNSAFVDSTFFKMFDFKLLKGNAANPFTGINSVILNETLAKKYFGDEEAQGKMLLSGNESFVVAGVMQDFPENSSIQYKMLFPMSLNAKQFAASGGNGDWKTMDEDLGNYQYTIFLQLQKNASVATVSKKITDIYYKHRNESPTGFYSLQSLKSLHLVATDGSESALQQVRIFMLVAILILIIACINYVNLSTARSMLRAKEVSMRKIIGAAKYQLFIQFITESALLFSLSSVLAFIIIYTLIPFYNNLAGKHLSFSLANVNVWLVVLSVITGSLALASIYPALLLSSFKPIQALRGKFSLGKGNTSFRKALVVTQFIFSVALITGTIVIAKQLKFIREKNLGYDKEQVFAFGISGAIHDHYAAVRDELLKQPGVLGLASSDNSIAGVNGSTGDTYWEGKEANRMFLIHPNGVDEHLIPLLKMQMAAGNNFSGSKADSMHFILNETAVKQAGIKDPIGKTFTLWQTKGTIIGVVKDFNYASLKEAIEPAIFYYNPPNWRIYIKTTAKDAAKAIAAAQRVWKQYSADSPLDYLFLDDEFNNMYSADQRTGTLFTAFGAIAILISCLGLFGLATYTAQVRTKEIGIRKVLGASVTTITRLLAKEFILLVVIAFVIATPIAWYAMNKWLQNYAYRTDINWWIFLATGILAILIALVTVSFQAIKAALANPVKSLRTD